MNEWRMKRLTKIMAIKKINRNAIIEFLSFCLRNKPTRSLKNMRRGLFLNEQMFASISEIPSNTTVSDRKKRLCPPSFCICATHRGAASKIADIPKIIFVSFIFLMSGISNVSREFFGNNTMRLRGPMPIIFNVIVGEAEFFNCLNKDRRQIN